MAKRAILSGESNSQSKNYVHDHQTVVAVVAGTLLTLIVLLVILILYLVRTRYYKPVATDEERRGLSSGPISGIPHIQTHGSLSIGGDSRFGGGGGYKARLYNETLSPANSNIQQLQRPPSLRSVQSLKDRRASASASSLTLSIKSSTSTSSRVSKLADKKQSGSSAVGATTPGSHSAARDQEILRQQNKPLNEFSLRKLMNNLGTLSGEFMSLPMNHPESIDVCGVAKKNRHTSILPNNHSRIRLCGNKYNSPVEGYINANYVRGYKDDAAAFIAAQGPLPGTVEDFWWMIWQEKVSIIVMITKLREKNKLMCEKYWPIKYTTYGDIMVTCEYSVTKNGYTVNGFLIAELQSASQRRVEQYCYLDWPDKEVPSKAVVILSIMEEIKKQKQSYSQIGPVLVHCSAGVGRTGCYIALSIAVEQYLAEKSVDILGTVSRIRLDRGGLVQTLEQYEFIHKAIVQLIEESRTTQSLKEDTEPPPTPCVKKHMVLEITEPS